MVWPILISVAVTPRISAAVDAVVLAKRASAPSTANFGIERIDTAPHLFLFGAQPGRARRQLNMPRAREGSRTTEMAAAKNAKARLDAGLSHYNDCQNNRPPHHACGCG